MDDYIKKVAQKASDLQDELVNQLLRDNGFDPEIYKTEEDLLRKGYMLIHTVENEMKRIRLVKIENEVVFSLGVQFDRMKMVDPS